MAHNGDLNFCEPCGGKKNQTCRSYNLTVIDKTKEYPHNVAIATLCVCVHVSMFSIAMRIIIKWIFTTTLSCASAIIVKFLYIFFMLQVPSQLFDPKEFSKYDPSQDLIFPPDLLVSLIHPFH